MRISIVSTVFVLMVTRSGTVTRTLAQSFSPAEDQLKREMNYLDSKIVAFAAKNTLLTTAVAITFGGIFKALTSQVTDNEAAITTLAAGYCLMNYDDCANAAAYLGPLLRTRAEYQTLINQLTMSYR